MTWGADIAVPHAEAAAAAKELGGVDLVVETVGEATWKDSLAAVKAGGQGRRLRRHQRAEPARAAASLLVEAAD